MKITILTLLALSFLPFAHADEAQIFQLCNHYDYTVYAAISEREPSDQPGGRVVKGWYTAKPGDCANIPIHQDYFYIHVRGRSGNQIRVTIPKPHADPTYDTNIDYCFDPNSKFEFHGMNVSYCPDGQREVFHDWYPNERGWSWDLR